MKGATVKTMIMLAPLVLITACGGLPEKEVTSNPTATVKTASAALGATGDTVTVYGVAEPGAGNERSMTVQAEAVMERVVVPTGTAARAGQVVAILRPSLTSRLDIAKSASDAASADATYARARRLRADGLVSDADVETARASAATANASRAASVQRSATLILRAPASGTIQNLIAKPGEIVGAGTAVATIGVSGTLRARFGIDPAVAQQVHPGQPIQVAATTGGAPIRATVAGVGPQIDATTRLASVFATLPAGAGVAAGEPLRGTINIGGSATGITIPYAALLDDGGHSYVFVVQGGMAKKRDVSPGNSAGDRIAILRGLTAGDRVVTEGGTALDDGMKVSEAGQAAKGQ